MLVLAATLATAGCTAPTPGQVASRPAAAAAASVTPPSPSPSPTPRATSPVPVAPPTHSATPVRTRTSTRPSRPDAAPRVDSVVITPSGDFIPPPCGSPPRLTVTARVSDPDDATRSLDVRLQYYLSNSYGATVKMLYDAGRNVFTYRLPAVEARDVGLQGGHLSASVTVTDPSGRWAPYRPVTQAILTIDACLGTIANP
jgi:hypothetical protein